MNKFFELVDAAVVLSLENRKKFDPRNIGMANYMMELCTVKIACGRALGKTAYIADRVRPWDVVVVPNQRHVDQAFRRDRHVFTFDELLNNVWGFRCGLPQLTPRTIYVDEGGSLTPDQLHLIWRHFTCHAEQTMVVLG